jgi:hypothetical protein
VNVWLGEFLSVMLRDSHTVDRNRTPVPLYSSSQRLKKRIRHFVRRFFPQIAALPDVASSHPRYGWGRPECAEFRKLCENQRVPIQGLLNSFLPYKDGLLGIPRSAWDNQWFPTLDAIALYCMLALQRPSKYIEIGSGNSTRFARHSITNNHLQTFITCIDPEPRIDVNEVADEVIRAPLQEIGVDSFKKLSAGDVLFVDSSHQAFMNSDVTILFLEILPVLETGVIVHFHDIHLPYDYPPDWTSLYYNEQYMLAAYMFGGNSFQLLLPNAFVTRDAELHKILDPLWNAPTIAGLPTHGASIWGTIRK